MAAGLGRHRHSVFASGASQVALVKVPEDDSLWIGMGGLGDKASPGTVEFQGDVDFGAGIGVEAVDPMLLP